MAGKDVVSLFSFRQERLLSSLDDGDGPPERRWSMGRFAWFVLGASLFLWSLAIVALIRVFH